MSTEHRQVGFYPSVTVYEVNRQRSVLLSPTASDQLAPDTYGQTATPALIFVVGALEQAAAQQHAQRIANDHQNGALRVAVCEVEEGAEATEARLSGLFAAFDAVLVVRPEQRRHVLDRLIWTLTLRDAQGPWIACDWDEVCRLAQASGGRFLRYGLGRGIGPERAIAASVAAITQLETSGARLDRARGLCVGLHAPSQDLDGRAIKAVVRQLQSRINRATSITLSIGGDSTLPADALEVDVFAFGELSATELIAASIPGTAQAASASAALPAAWEGLDQRCDPLYPHARTLVLAQQRASISLVQRHLRIGYGRAARLLDAMEGDILSAKDADGQRALSEASESPR